MSADEDSPQRSGFANQGEVGKNDAAALDSPTGREDHLGLAESRRVAGSDIRKPVGAQPRSRTTGRHDAGSGANETSDGLSASEEALRRHAEDTPSGRTDASGDVPVFDRRDRDGTA